MPTLNPPQQDMWNDNVYVLTTTRILIVIGVSYLLRSLFQLIKWSCISDVAVARHCQSPFY